MGWKSLIGSSVLAVGALATTGCYGKVDKGNAPKVVGSYAELVMKKKTWLRGYDEDCQVCFHAFEQCALGASSDVEKNACQPALDACVRGGLEKQPDPNGDAGADPTGDDGTGDPGAGSDPNAGGGDVPGTGDDGSDPANVTQDAGAGDDTGGGLSDGTGSSDDAGAGDDSGSSDGAGSEDGTGSSGGVGSVGGSDDAGVDGAGGNDSSDDSSNDGSSNDGASGGGGNVDGVKKQLIGQIEVCLEQAHTCVSSDNPVIRDCVSALNVCVRSAIREAFGGICAGQIGACVADKAPEQALQSVENICQLGLDLIN